MAKTVGDVLDSSASRYADRPAMRVKRAGSWQTTTWSEYQRGARRVARGFLKLGLRPGQGVAIMGYNRPEWFLADIGAILAGGVPAGIYTSSSAEQVRYIAEHCEAAVVVVENPELLAVVKRVRNQLPVCKAIVMMDGEDGDEGVMTWQQLLEAGDEVSDADLDERVAEQKPDDLCTLIYTSGTTGPPKAVMLSHHNLTWTSQAASHAMDALKPGDSFISYLPLSHIAEQLVSLHVPMAFGGCSWFAESLEKLGDNLREVRPAAFLAVPRVWEKIQAKIVAAAAHNSPVKKAIGRWARAVGLRAGYAEQRGESPPAFTWLAQRLVFSKVRDRLGLDRCRFAITSTAPTAKDTLEFFLSLGIPLLEIYGMSEATGPATLSLPERYKTGKAGFAIPECEIKIAEDGEICMRGPNIFLGYLKDDKATREALDEDGWLHSGDIGELDSEGYLAITDRKKELIITAGGKNISPQQVECQLKTIPVVSQAVAIGDGRKFISALLTLDVDRLVADAEAMGSRARDPDEAARDDVFLSNLKEQVDKACTNLSRVEAVKKFKVIPHELTIEGGELTPTMKLKRRVIHEKYADVIESMYE